MNVSSNPTPEQLRVMLARLDDQAAAHIPWVGHDGEVHIDPLPEELTPIGFAELHKDRIKYRLETLDRGNGYVGPGAADDDKWVNRLFNALVDFWKKNAKGYQDYF